MEKDRFDKFYHLTYSALKSIQRLKIIGMTPYELTGTHTMCLRHLYAAPDGLTRTKLVRLCDVDKAQVSRIINELCAKGYVSETESENANYRKRLKLTRLGVQTAEQINSHVLEINKFVSGDIPDEQLQRFYETLECICKRLEDAEEFFGEKMTEKTPKSSKLKGNE